jgi:hypothetical protein
MPQIKIRGNMIDNLVGSVKWPRDYFEIECIKSVAIRDGK